ncbi:MAG: ubiquinol-cytochrome C chaperone family protein [Alphaproteobacteria bacterium]
MIFAKFFGTSDEQKAVARLYEGIVRQSRDPGLYLHCGAADTTEGRFDMITLHTVLVMRRLKDDGEAARTMSQTLFDHMFADVDMNLRELGVGDMGISRRIKKMISAFYGRLAAYDEALSEDGDEALMAALKRNLDQGEGIDDATLARLAAYMRESWVAIQAMDPSRLLVGDVDLAPVPGASS